MARKKGACPFENVPNGLTDDIEDILCGNSNAHLFAMSLDVIEQLKDRWETHYDFMDDYVYQAFETRKALPRTPGVKRPQTRSRKKAKDNQRDRIARQLFGDNSPRVVEDDRETEPSKKVVKFDDETKEKEKPKNRKNGKKNEKMVEEEMSEDVDERPLASSVDEEEDDVFVAMRTGDDNDIQGSDVAGAIVDDGKEMSESLKMSDAAPDDAGDQLVSEKSGTEDNDASEETSGKPKKKPKKKGKGGRTTKRKKKGAVVRKAADDKEDESRAQADLPAAEEGDALPGGDTVTENKEESIVATTLGDNNTEAIVKETQMRVEEMEKDAEPLATKNDHSERDQEEDFDGKQSLTSSSPQEDPDSRPVALEDHPINLRSVSETLLCHDLSEPIYQVEPSCELEIKVLTSLVGSRFIVPVFNELEIKEIEAIEGEDQLGRFLQAWIKKYCLDATQEALCAALFAADLGSSAKEVFPEVYENMTKEALLDPSRQIKREELAYNEDKDFVGGEVFKATLMKDGEEKPVAVKVFCDFRRRREAEYDMFKKEASVLLQIKPNPFILGLIGLCAVPGHYALVTEFVSGGSLWSLLKSHEHKDAVDQWETRVKFAKQIAEGMLYLHYHHPSVIHQDLKSQNVLVDIVRNRKDAFICKVADFGLAKMSGISSITTERDGSRPAGTVTHIAPERYSDHPCGEGDESAKKDLARKSDVYSYGVLLWEIREKQHPYQGMRKDIIRLHVMGGGQLPKGLATNVPPVFNEILMQCVKFNPQERPMFRDVLLTLNDGDGNPDEPGN